MTDADEKTGYWSIAVCDVSLFDVFDFDFIEGDTAALADPRSLAITQRAAAYHFGDDDAIGKVFTRDDHEYYFGDYVITAVLADPPEKSSLQFDFVTTNKVLAVEWTPWPIWQPHGHYRLVALHAQ